MQPLLAAGCALARPIENDDHSRAQSPAREKPLMPASVQSARHRPRQSNTVPYHKQRLLKSAEVPSYFLVAAISRPARSTFYHGAVARDRSVREV
jgi:hypothetical protein